MQAALTAVIALLSLSLVSSFLDKEIFEYCFQEKQLKWLPLIYTGLVSSLLGWALYVLPGTAQAESFSNAEEGAQAAYRACASIAVGGFFLQAVARYEMMKKNGKKTRANEDNNTPLDDSTKHSVATPEGSQQQAIDTPEEDGRKPQKEPNPTGSQNRGG